MKTEQDIRTKIQELKELLEETEEEYDSEIEFAEDEDNMDEVTRLEEEKNIKVEEIEKQMETLEWVLGER